MRSEATFTINEFPLCQCAGAPFPLLCIVVGHSISRENCRFAVNHLREMSVQCIATKPNQTTNSMLTATTHKRHSIVWWSDRMLSIIKIRWTNGDNQPSPSENHLNGTTRIDVKASTEWMWMACDTTATIPQSHSGRSNRESNWNRLENGWISSRNRIAHTIFHVSFQCKLVDCSPPFSILPVHNTKLTHHNTICLPPVL